MGKKVTESSSELGKALAAARNAANLKQSDVAKSLRNQSWISRVENGAVRPTPNELDMLLDKYQPDEELRKRIEELYGPPPASARHDAPLCPKFRKLKRLELAASEVRVFISERLPMQLQSEQYTLLQYHLAGLPTTPAEVLAERMRRLQLLTRENAPPFFIVMTDSALTRMPGGRLDLVKEQASYLLDCLDRFPQLHLRVLRRKADIPYVAADRIILGFADKQRDRVFVPIDATVHELNGREASNSKAYWHLAHDAALGVDKSRKFIHNLAENGYQPQPWEDNL